jgi:hypothetical protein
MICDLVINNLHPICIRFFVKRCSVDQLFVVKFYSDSAATRFKEPYLNPRP